MSDILFKKSLSASHPIDLLFNESDDAPPEVIPSVGDLLFKESLSTNHPVNLVFNSGSYEPEENHELTLSATTSPPNLTSSLTVVNSLLFGATALAPSCSAVLTYDNAVYRGPARHTASPFEIANKKNKFVSDLVQKPKPTVKFTRVHHTLADKLSDLSTILVENAVPKHEANSSSWQWCKPVGDIVGDTFGELTRFRNKTFSGWTRATSKNTDRGFTYKELLRKPRPEKMSSWDNGVMLSGVFNQKHNVAVRKNKDRRSIWGEAKQPDHGKYVRPVKPGTGDGYIPPSGVAVNLIFSELWSSSTNLIFGVKSYVPAGKVIPVREVYKVINSSDLRLVSTDQRIKTISMSMSIDMDSWAWGFNAEIGYDELSKVSSVSGNPVLVDATVNGTDLRFVIESVRKVRKFGKTTLSVTGRGFSAELSDTYSPDLTFKNELERTAQQLMNDALTINGVSLGWVIDWQIEDWSVPAGVWSHQGSYMSAVTTIANSVGAFVLPDFATKKLSVISRNKVKPWDMSTATADLEIPSAVTETESISWDNGNEYNAVYVSGSSASSVLGLVKRIGTAGDKHAPMVTDALITDAVAARLRGVYELSKFGVKEKRELSLPILPLTGIILPGTIVKYTDNGSSATGVVMGVNVNVGLPSIRQSITVETYV